MKKQLHLNFNLFFTLMYKYLVPLLLFLSLSCVHSKKTIVPIEPCVASNHYPSKAKKAVIIIMDGARFSETFGDSTLQYIPAISKLQSQASLCRDFYNNNITNTINGCCACIAGNYNALTNNSSAAPIYPNVLHYYLYCKQAGHNKACIISSKDKMAALANFSSDEFNYPSPYTDCGINGLNSGYRADTITYKRCIDYLNSYQPDISFITFREPDFSGHTGVWTDYLKGIRLTDSLIGTLVAFLDQHPAYHNNTNIFITNDHGRHLDTIADGFVNHGDDCEGCRHIFLVALGPDIKKNYVAKEKHELVDVSTTVAYLFHLGMKNQEGKVLNELLE